MSLEDVTSYTLLGWTLKSVPPGFCWNCLQVSMWQPQTKLPLRILKGSSQCCLWPSTWQCLGTWNMKCLATLLLQLLLTPPWLFSASRHLYHGIAPMLSWGFDESFSATVREIIRVCLTRMGFQSPKMERGAKWRGSGSRNGWVCTANSLRCRMFSAVKNTCLVSVLPTMWLSL